MSLYGPTFVATPIRTSRRTVVSDGRDWIRQSNLDRTSFFVSAVLLSTIILLFLVSSCLIVLFQSCCSHAQVFRKTLVHEFLIFYSYTEWNLLCSGSNALLWWRACYKTTNQQLELLVRELNGSLLIQDTDF